MSGNVPSAPKIKIPPTISNNRPLLGHSQGYASHLAQVLSSLGSSSEGGSSGVGAAGVGKVAGVAPVSIMGGVFVRVVPPGRLVVVSVVGSVEAVVVGSVIDSELGADVVFSVEVPLGVVAVGVVAVVPVGDVAVVVAVVPLGVVALGVVAVVVCVVDCSVGGSVADATVNRLKAANISIDFAILFIYNSFRVYYFLIKNLNSLDKAFGLLITIIRIS